MKTKDLVLDIRNTRNFKSIKIHFATHPKKLNELVELVVNQEPYPLCEYASWILLHLSKSQGEQLQPFYTKFVDHTFVSVNQTVLRNIVNTIHHLQINEYRESELIDQLINFIKKSENKVALQVYSMYVLVHFVGKHPELRDEIMETIVINSVNKSRAYQVAMRNFEKLTSSL